MRDPLNLASRPAGNERLPGLLFAVAAVALALVTVRHAFLVAGLASSAATRLDREVEQLQGELRELKQREQRLGTIRPPAAAVERWTLLKGLVDQRTFSWTGLLGSLESALPSDVRLTAIKPESRKGHLHLAVEAVARSAEDALKVVRILEERPEFASVLVLSIGEGREGTMARYEMRYLPEAKGVSADPDPAASASPRVEPGP